jgi:hypothetical protein
MFDLVGFLKGLLITNEADRSKSLNLQVSNAATTNTSTLLTASQTANRTITLPDADGTLSTPSATETLTNKTIDGDTNTIQDISLASLKTELADANKVLVRDATGLVVSSTVANAQVAPAANIALNKLAPTTVSRALVSDSSGVIASSAVTSTELGNVSGVTSPIQTQINTLTTAVDTKPSRLAPFTDNRVLRADSTTGVQDSAVVIDDSGNITQVTSLRLTLAQGLLFNANIITAPTSLLYLTTGSTSDAVFTDRILQVGSPASGTPGQIRIVEDQATGNQYVTLQPATLSANRSIVLPDADTTMVGTNVAQTLSNKSFSDAITAAQVSTPSAPAASNNKLYFKSDSRMYSQNSSGTEFTVAYTQSNVATLSSATTLTLSNDVVLCNTTSAGFTVTLPSAVTTSGKTFVIKKTSSDTNILTVATTSAQTIDGASTALLFVGNEEITLQSNGSNWIITNRYFPTQVISNGPFTTIPAGPDIWTPAVGGSIDLPHGVWEITGYLTYGNNGSAVGYGNRYMYWAGAQADSSSTLPAAVSTVATVLAGGPLTPIIWAANSDNTSTMVMPPIIVRPTAATGASIFMSSRAVMSTTSNARWVAQMSAKRIG